MRGVNFIAAIVLGVVLLKLGAQIWLERLNRLYVLGHADGVPEPFKDFVSQPTYAKSVQYTLAKGRLHTVELIYHTAVLVMALFSGVLPWAFALFSHSLGRSVWAMAAYLFA